LICSLGKTRDRETRIAAARSLGKLRDPRAVEPLIRLLMDGYPAHSGRKAGRHDKWVRREAAWALGELKDGRAWESLLRVSEDATEEKDVREVSATGFWRVVDAQATESLLHSLEADTQAQFSPITAARALVLLKEPRVVEPLIRMLYRDVPFEAGYRDTRKATAELLGNRATREPWSR